MPDASLVGPACADAPAIGAGPQAHPRRARPSQAPLPALVRVLGAATRVYSRQRGTRRRMASFRMTNAGAGGWTVDGVVDIAEAAEFGAAVQAALATAAANGGGVLRLRFDELDLIDAAGLAALVDAVKQTPGSTVRIEGANAEVRRLWRLSGYPAADLPVEMSP